MRYIGSFIIAFAVSGYFFPVAFTFLPPSITTKIILGGLGILIYISDRLNSRRLDVSGGFLTSTILAIIFSIICFFAVDYNGTSDYSYATYIFSFLLWIAGAYGVGSLIKLRHGEFNIPLLTSYLAGVSIFQCIIAIVIDKNESVKNFVDLIFYKESSFIEDVNRLYGIGAALDPAGVRFSTILILISFVLVTDEFVKRSRGMIIYYLLSFIITAVIGNMISRTTTTGLLFALFVLVVYSGILHLVIKRTNVKLYTTFIVVIGIGVVASTLLYNSDPYFHDLLRFGFEGFFNWVETGEWSTGSTDKLNAVMWVWPQTMEAWVIGTGLFEGWVYSTDIGYCRFILYCGLIGFSSFVVFFAYNAYYFYRHIREYKYLFILLFLLAFVIWIKVSTDIFFVFALFYWMDYEKENKENETLLAS